LLNQQVMQALTSESMCSFAACSQYTALHLGALIHSCKTFEFITSRGIKQADDPELTRQMKISLKTFLVQINAFAHEASRLELKGRDLALFKATERLNV
jgi:hypothetical protein